MNTLKAKLAQRFIFNFRICPSTVASIIQSDRLAPQVVNGWAVGSFCILELQNIGFGSIPNLVGPSSVNCSYRYGAVDVSSGEPCVFVEERCTNSRLGSWLTSLGFPGFHPYVDADIEEGTSEWRIGTAGPVTFSATVLKDEAEPSQLFDTVNDFKDFMALGKRSYCTATDESKLNIVDLKKSDPIFETLNCAQWRSNRFEGEVLDSVYRTVGGDYEWTYIGQTTTQLVAG